MNKLKGPFTMAGPDSDAKIILDRINQTLASMDELMPIGDKIRKALVKEAV